MILVISLDPQLMSLFEKGVDPFKVTLSFDFHHKVDRLLVSVNGFLSRSF